MFTSQVYAPNAEFWRPQVDGAEIIFSRMDIAKLQPASVYDRESHALVSLAEMALSSGRAAIEFEITGSLRIQTALHDGSAVIETTSGRVVSAAGTLRGLSHKRLKHITRQEGSRPFFTLKGDDYLLDPTWIPKLFPPALKKENACVLSLFPKNVDLDPGADISEQDDARLVRSRIYEDTSKTVMGLRVEIHDASIGMFRYRGKTQCVVAFSGSFKNLSSNPILVQPALLRPLIAGDLRSEGAAARPLGRPNSLAPNSGGLTSQYSGFIAGGDRLGPTRILASGAAGSFSRVRMPLSLKDVTQAKGKFIDFSYSDGTRKMKIRASIAVDGKPPSVADSKSSVKLPASGRLLSRRRDTIIRGPHLALWVYLESICCSKSG